MAATTWIGGGMEGVGLWRSVSMVDIDVCVRGSGGGCLVVESMNRWLGYGNQ